LTYFGIVAEDGGGFGCPSLSNSLRFIPIAVFKILGITHPCRNAPPTL
jgi:hypothetical protein